MTPEQALLEAVRRVGSRAALARELGVSKQAAQEWRIAPSRHVWKIARATGLTHRELRPDLYPRAKKSGWNLTRCWQAQKAFIDAVEELPPEALGFTRESRDRYLNDITLLLEEPH
jgi:DNA-binding transcriptional regulator YdaS (Cro superfamily)